MTTADAGARDYWQGCGTCGRVPGPGEGCDCDRGTIAAMVHDLGYEWVRAEVDAWAPSDDAE